MAKKMNQAKKNLPILRALNILLWIKFVMTENMTGFDMLSLKAAITFSEKWVLTPKQYFCVVLPSTTHLRIQNVANLTERIRKRANRNSYFTFGADLTLLNKTKHYQDEILWFPFEIKSYNTNCQKLGFSDDNLIREKHLLFFAERIDSAVSFFETCQIRFDDNIVVYYRENKTRLNHIIFEELYKIDPLQATIHRNILSRIDLDSKKTELHLSIEYIWKRRNDLHGTKFQGLTENYPPFVNSIKQYKDSKENTVVLSEGYIPSILDHLKYQLNFTIITNLPKQRYSWSYLIEQVEKGAYDIGETGFIFTSARNDVVDFSFSVLSLSYSFVYAKNLDVFRLDLFLQPYRNNAWMAVLLYIATSIISISTFAFIFEKCHHQLMWKEFARSLQKPTNFILRSIVGKRIDVEPKKNWMKVAFVFLVLNGFFLITCYRALLVASLTAQVQSPPLNSLRDFVGSKYILAIQQSSATEKIFLDAEPDSPEDLIVKNRNFWLYSSNHESVLEKMVSDKDMASNTIILIERPAVQNHEFYPCRLVEIEQFNQKYQGNTGMIFRKTWPFKDFFNYHLLVMKEVGMMDRLYKPFRKATKKSCPNQQLIKSVIDKPTPVSMNASFFLYLIILIGFVTSCLCLAVEFLCQRYEI